MNNVFYCSDCKLSVVNISGILICITCNKEMKIIGWIEKWQKDLLEEA